MSIKVFTYIKKPLLSLFSESKIEILTILEHGIIHYKELISCIVLHI